MNPARAGDGDTEYQTTAERVEATIGAGLSRMKDGSRVKVQPPGRRAQNRRHRPLKCATIFGGVYDGYIYWSESCADAGHKDCAFRRAGLVK